MLDHAMPSDMGRGCWVEAGLAACPGITIRRCGLVLASLNGLDRNRLDNHVVILGRLLASRNGNEQTEGHKTFDSIRH
ncbi:hypothetical protein [Roseovarius sp. Pro17]|uniref:hypothetical protein n=1 Tax=Roseovarius sp. Pro17 TaxID=3108175 RepID=UPI002D79E7B1|nr:hypothetical protein [Roseovarius sp. Pro17]